MARVCGNTCSNGVKEAISSSPRPPMRRPCLLAIREWAIFCPEMYGTSPLISLLAHAALLGATELWPYIRNSKDKKIDKSKVQTHFRSRIKGKKDASHFVPGPFRAGTSVPPSRCICPLSIIDLFLQCCLSVRLAAY